MKKLLIIVGPTGTGKTEVAIKLAEKFNGEIVSADSRQIYKGMNIGTGKIDVGSKVSDVNKEKGKWVVGGVPVHLYDIITPDKTFSVAQYQQLAYKKINEIFKKNKLPILVGGTGLYVRSVVQGLKIPQVAPNKKIREGLEKKQLSHLLEELKKVDPKAYLKIDKSNSRRVIRALEVYHKTGQPISSLQQRYQPDFETLLIGLIAPRNVLYQQTDERIDKWFKQGLIEEVKRLLSKGYKSDLPSMTSLGYRQIIAYLEGRLSLGEAKKRIKFEHHGFIRRQLTWFKKEPNINWFDITDQNFGKEVLLKVREWV